MSIYKAKFGGKKDKNVGSVLKIRRGGLNMEKYKLLVKELEWLKRKIEDASVGVDGEIEEKIREVINSSGEESIDELIVRILILIGG